MKTYKNPFLFENQWSENECGDPYILRFDGLYYLYCSSAGDHIKCWSSQNLVDFKYEGSVCDDPIIYGAYAPEVSYYKGKFYMITSPKGSGHYLLESTKPTGPFSIISDNYGLMIDGSIFVDDDGKQYMLRAGHQGVVIHNMPSPGKIGVNGKTIPEAYLNYWTEGPMIIKRNGLYYLTYTGNHLLSKGYRVAYSVSESAPDSGYINLKNRVVLLETGQEFHALGHSSSFLGPDLDSYCIAYHTMNLDCVPFKRSTCIDRLFFNGARMYSNPVWWEQPAMRMPDYSCRGAEELQNVEIGVQQYIVTPQPTPAVYTAELNIRPFGASFTLVYGLKDGYYGTICFENNHSYKIYESDTLILEGSIPPAISFDGNIAVRFSKKADSNMEIYLNNLRLCNYVSELGSGVFGVKLGDNQIIGYLAYSSVTEGKGDKVAYKAVPGRFDAVHCTEEIEKVKFLDSGFDIFAGRLLSGQQYSFNVNVYRTDKYKILARIKRNGEQYGLKVITSNDQTILEGLFTGICDEEGYETVTIGTISLTKGMQQLRIEATQGDLVVDWFELIRYSDSITSEIVKDGRLVAGELQILGHKKEKSLIHKYSGFTCAENHGMGFIGEAGMSDYRISGVIHRNSINTGDVSVFIRATKESWYAAQVAEALFGYRIRVTADGIYLYKEAYDERLLSYYSFGFKNSSLELDIEAIGSRIVISVDRNTVIMFLDPEPFLYGKVGIEATGEGFGFESLSVAGSIDTEGNEPDEK